ncbi:MAG: elongation factor Ts, partial [Clostridia bacterium]|nr:elongation factor Ts [Clostridia bacterium]
LAQALEEGKPQNLAEKMVEGRIKSYYEDNCLLNQKFVKDPSKTIEQMVMEATATIGEKIAVRRFVRYEMGEGLQKKSENLADEVEAQVAKMKG